MAEVMRITKSAQPGWSDLCNQVKRAATSIALNIAEGCAEFSPAEKARFYRIALRSAAECHAGCEVMVRVNVTTADMVVAVQSELNEIVPMLVALCKRHSE